jgi:hypothetical protein
LVEAAIVRVPRPATLPTPGSGRFEARPDVGQRRHGCPRPRRPLAIALPAQIDPSVRRGHICGP